MRNLKNSLAALLLAVLAIVLTILIVSTGCTAAESNQKPEAPKNHATTLDSVIADEWEEVTSEVADTLKNNDNLPQYDWPKSCNHNHLNDLMADDPNVDNIETQILWHYHFHNCLDKNSDGEIDDDQHPELYPKKYGTYISPKSIQDLFNNYDDFDWGDQECGE